MQQLCFLSGLSSEQWAAWVQAIGSLAALVVAIWIAAWQATASRKLVEDQMLRAQEEERSRRSEVQSHSRAVAIGAVNELGMTAKQLVNMLVQYKKRDFVPSVIEILEEAANPVRQIPLLDLPEPIMAIHLVSVRHMCGMARQSLEVQAPGRLPAPAENVVNPDGLENLATMCTRFVQRHSPAPDTKAP
jgi:hypothetical protein